MPICIECRYPVSTLYTTYSKADDKGVRLTQCPRCKRFADKYVEHDFVVLFIDLVLIKPQVYRHLLFNRLGRDDERLDPSIVRLGILLLLFDVYLTWDRVEKATPPTPLTTQPLLLQYLFFLALCTLETISFHLPIRSLLFFEPPRPLRTLIPHYPRPALISTALLISSFTKLFPLLLLIWRYDLPSSASAVSSAVIINNVGALEILLDCGYVRAVVFAAVGAVCRATVGWVILRAAGMGNGTAAAGVVETGDLVVLWRKLMESSGLG